MGAGPLRSGLIAGLLLALVPVVVADAAFASTGFASVERRCGMVKVKLKRDGKVVKRDGRPVFRRVRRCRLVPSPGCRFVKVKKRKNGKVVRRNGRPVFIKVERCPPKPQPPAPEPGPEPGPGPGPGPGPQPGPADELANRVLAMAPHVPGNIDLFTSEFPNGADGLYPAGSAMTPASGTPPTADQVRALLVAYLNRWFGGDTAKVNGALALYDEDGLETLAPDPSLRAAVAAMKGTVLEPTIDYLLTGGKFISIDWGVLPNAATIANSSGGSTNRVITFNERYEAESFEYLIGTMGHEILHDDGSNPAPEEVILKAFTGMAYMQVLAKTPELAHGGTELARQNNTQGMLVLNSREAGSPNSEIYAPTGLGVAPGSPYDAPDHWTIFGGDSGSSAGSVPLRTIVQNILTGGTPIPDPLNFNQATAELFANLNDVWLSDVERAQISVLLQLVTVDEIAQATGLGQQQIIDTLELQPYVDAIQ